eukprot:UN26540
MRKLNADIGTPEGQEKVKNEIGSSPVYVLAHNAHMFGEMCTLMDQNLDDFRDISVTVLSLIRFISFMSEATSRHQCF